MADPRLPLAKPIDPLKPPVAPDAPATQRADQPTPPSPPTAPERATVPDPARVADVSDSPVEAAVVRRPATDHGRPRTTVVEIEINLTCERVALLAADGPPYRGDVATDLLPGCYWVTVDRQRKLWIFEARQVKSGLRFSVTIDGPDPFTLEYSERLLLSVHRGIAVAGGDALPAVIGRVDQAVYDQDFGLALAELCSLSQIDLYDVLDELWATKPGVLNEILLHFVEASRLSDVPGQAGVLRALESFARTPKELFVDSFSSWQVHPDSFRPDPDRADKSTLQILLTYDLVPQRQLLVYADDITEDREPLLIQPVYGPNALTYPSRLSLGTTPRLHAAKRAAIAQVEEQNAAFITEAFRQVANALLSVYQASLSLAKLASARAAPRTVRRGPGEWQPDGEVGTNMPKQAMDYQVTSCGSPRGMGYYVGRVQFDGYVSRTNTLLDAKFWKADGYIMKMLRRGHIGIANKEVIQKAERQLAAARLSGARVEWRVSSREAADFVRAMFRNNNLDIEVVHIPPL